MHQRVSLSCEGRLWYACHPLRAHEEAFLAREELVRRGWIVLFFSLKHCLDVTELPFSTNLLFVLFPVRIFYFLCVKIFLFELSQLWSSSHEFASVCNFSFCATCGCAVQTFSQCFFKAYWTPWKSCQGYKAVLFQSWAGFLAWSLGYQAAEDHLKKHRTWCNFMSHVIRALNFCTNKTHRGCPVKLRCKWHNPALL